MHDSNSSTQEPPRPVEPRPSRLMLALLDPGRRLDYLWLALIGALPSAVAWYFSLHESFDADGRHWVGFFDKPNMWPQVVLLPLFAFVVRWTTARIADVSRPDCPADAPSIVRLFPDEQREAAYASLRAALASTVTLRLLLCFVLIVMALDMTGVVRVYLTGDGTITDEYDWSIMFLTGHVSAAENLCLVVAAYFMQTVLFVFRFLAIVFIAQHNIFFLRHVWQRRRAERSPEQPLIELDVDDPERCFGLRPASTAFDTQALLLAIGGAAILLSRFAQIGADAGVGWNDVLQWPPQIAPAVGFPDAGQWILATMWSLSLTVALMPMAVKFLPLAAPRGPEQSLGEFLREALAGEQRAGDGSRFAERAAAFAAQSFWPAGDGRARMLFVLSCAVFIVILYPLRIEDGSLRLVAFGLLGALSWVLAQLGFVLLRLPLAFVDERLVRQVPMAVTPEAAPEPIEGPVFVSYRRDDSGAYARLLHRALLEQMPAERVFMDLESISDGEDFVDRIDAAVAASRCMLVVVGPQWTTLRGSDGVRRLDAPGDFVVREVERALAEDVLVIPVLVAGAQMPAEEALPPALARFWRLQARVLDDGHWDYDVAQLLEAVRAGTRR